MALLCWFLLAAAEPPQVAPAAFYAPNEELRGYLVEAGEKHPALKKMHSEWLAALERVPQVTALDDPMLQFSYWIQSDQYRYAAMLSQEFPWFGTLHLKGEQAKAEAEAALTRLYAERNKVFAEVKKAYFEYAFLAESIHSTEQQSEVLKYTADIAQNRYGVGMANQADLLRIQTEVTRLQDRYDGFMQSKPALAARLNAAIGRESASDLPWPQPMELPPPPPPAPVVLARLRMSSPELAESDHLIAGRESAINLAHKAAYPNFTLSLSYTDMKDPRQPNAIGPSLDILNAMNDWSMAPASFALPGLAGPNASIAQRARAIADRAGAIKDQTITGGLGKLMDINSVYSAKKDLDNIEVKDEVMVQLGMSLPIWRGKIKAGIREAEFMREAAQEEKHERALSLDAQAQIALYGMENGMRRVKLFADSLIPQSRQTYDALLSSYASSASEVGFLDVLGSIQTLLDFELEMHEAKRDLQMSAADLELVMGGPWADKGVPAPTVAPLTPLALTPFDIEDLLSPLPEKSAAPSPEPAP